MQVVLLNNTEGYSELAEHVYSGMTVSEFVTKNCPDNTPFEDFLVRVTRRVEPNFILNDGDRVSVTPLKIYGD
jgi:hypothetical protein